MSRSDDVFRPALAGRKIPILTLDGKWHQLFNQTQPDKRIKRLEEMCVPGENNRKSAGGAGESLEEPGSVGVQSGYSLRDLCG